MLSDPIFAIIVALLTIFVAFLGKFSFFIIPPPSITVRRNFVDTACCKRGKEERKGWRDQPCAVSCRMTYTVR